MGFQIKHPPKCFLFETRVGEFFGLGLYTSWLAFRRIGSFRYMELFTRCYVLPSVTLSFSEPKEAPNLGIHGWILSTGHFGVWTSSNWHVVSYSQLWCSRRYLRMCESSGAWPESAIRFEFWDPSSWQNRFTNFWRMGLGLGGFSLRSETRV